MIVALAIRVVVIAVTISSVTSRCFSGKCTEIDSTRGQTLRCVEVFCDTEVEEICHRVARYYSSEAFKLGEHRECTTNGKCCDIKVRFDMRLLEKYEMTFNEEDNQCKVEAEDDIIEPKDVNNESKLEDESVNDNEEEKCTPIDSQIFLNISLIILVGIVTMQVLDLVDHFCKVKGFKIVKKTLRMEPEMEFIKIFH